MEPAGILLIEDDTALGDELARVLDLAGYTVIRCDDFANAAASILSQPCDCVLLDLKLPGADGHEICRAIRAQSSVPIIVITSSDQEFDEIMALKLGADDYLTKPFSPAVLIAHIQAALRRTAPSQPKSAGGVTIDEVRATVSYHGATAELTRNELRLLTVLISHPNAVTSRRDLMAALWQSDEFIDDNTLTVNMNRLRRVLADIGVPRDFIVTRRGLGYQINPCE